MEDKYYTPQEIAELLKVAYMTVYRWIRAGKLQAYQVQKQYRIREADFNKFMETNKKTSLKTTS
jgi:excisionase family DNA binding protein